jgi:hypothetical protein
MDSGGARRARRGALPAAVSNFVGCYERLARRRRRRRGLLLGSGSNPLVGSSVFRSIRITGRMITVADSELPAIDFDPRPVRSTGRKLMTVPISLSPAH